VGFDALGIRKIMVPNGVNNIPIVDLLATTSFIGEAGATVNVDPTVRMATLSAKQLRTKIGSSWLMNAMGVGIDALLSQTLEAAKINKLNQTVMTGAGTSTEPIGILGAAGTVDVTGANGAAATYDLLITMLNAPSANDASFVAPAWATSPAVREILQKLKLDAGSGQFVWNQLTPAQLLGFVAAVSTHVPTNIAKGSGTNLKAAVFGYWDQMVQAEWSVKELITDNVTDETGPKLIEISFVDHAILNPLAFAKAYFV
jgi:HK97 family phage major capsid protein